MGLFGSLLDVITDTSDNSIENKILKGIDKVEKTLSTSIDKAESGVKKIDSVSKKTERVINVVDAQTKKVTSTDK